MHNKLKRHSYGLAIIIGIGLVLTAGTAALAYSFWAESRCEAASWCSVRAVVTSAENGLTSELNPASGTNFVFDSGGQRGARSFSRIAI